MARVLGLDISKMSATYCLLDRVPPDPKRWARRNKPKSVRVGPGGRDELLSLDFDFAVMEPTGVYSRVWRHWLRESGRAYRLVGHQELKSYREGWKIASKTDKLDSLALALYGIEREHRAECWLRERDHRLSDLIALHSHLNTQKSGLQNYLRQKLCYQVPEWYEKKLSRQWGGGRVPGILQAIAGEPTPKWQRELGGSCGVGLDDTAASLARILQVFEEEEIGVEAAICEELEKPQYARYLRACEEVGFSEWLRVNVIAAIFPFEQFLRDGRRITTHVYTSNGKRVRRDESLRSFKLCCGLGLVWVQSGDWSGWMPGGNGQTRKALRNSVSAQYLKNRRIVKRGEEGDRRLELVKNAYDNRGMLQVARRELERLYRALVREFEA